jgi:hypothetical protein
MRTALIKRTESSDEGTFGVFLADTGKFWVAGELPWVEGIPSISCIPVGTYSCEWAQSPRFGWCYHVRKVPGRNDILIHVGNFIGNFRKGLTTDVLGCILLGKDKGELKNAMGAMQMAVKQSAPAVLELEAEYRRQTFTLTISDATASAAELVSRADDFKKAA